MSVDKAWRKYNHTHKNEQLTRSAYRGLVKPEGLITSASALERILFVPDTHRPFHDQKAWNLMLKAGRFFKPDRIVVLGDMADMWSISSHDKNPARKMSFPEEVQDVNKAFDDLDSLGAKHKDFVEGNHCFRLDRYLMTVSPQLYALPGLTTREMFHLTERGWTYTPYKHHIRIGKLYVTHDAGNAGAQAHVKAGNKFQSNVVIGHTHRIGVHYFSSATGESFVAGMFGWLGAAAAGEEYMNAVNMNVDWHLGFGLGWMDPKGNVILQAVPIVNYTVVVNGVIVR
jgi:predicted phosphodiesterase